MDETRPNNLFHSCPNQTVKIQTLKMQLNTHNSDRQIWQIIEKYVKYLNDYFLIDWIVAQ